MSAVSGCRPISNLSLLRASVRRRLANYRLGDPSSSVQLATTMTGLTRVPQTSRSSVSSAARSQSETRPVTCVTNLPRENT